MVNIIVPFYNAEATLEKTLASVEAQTFSNWSVIFIDDGSTDSSPLIAEKFLIRNNSKGKLIKSIKARSGPSVGRNQALQYAEAPYVICLDSDDLLSSFCLEQRVATMEKNPELHWAIFNQYQCSPGEEPPLKIFNKPMKTRSAAIEVFLKMDVAWQTMAPIWKTEALRSLSFDEALYPSEDPDLHLRALLDLNLDLKICSDLPPDCYYQVANKTGDKLLLFYSQSINSKFRFLKKTVEYLPNVVPAPTLKVYRSFLRVGFFHFYRTFLLARLSGYKKELDEMLLFLKEQEVLTIRDFLINKMTLTALLNSPPKIHNWGSGELSSSGLPTAVLELMDNILNAQTRTLETGMGISTALFALKGTAHTCINPDKEEIYRFNEYINRNGISMENMVFIAKRSDEVWFDLKENRWDFVLIDGCHGFPIPYMDWYFFSQGLKINGHLVIDDTLISTGKELKEFLLGEDSWELIAPFSLKTAVFKKIKEFDYNKEFIFQPSVLNATKALNKPNRFIEFARRAKRKLKKLV